VAHSGPVTRGAFVQTLVVTDIASGWTELAPLLVREQTLLVDVLGEIRRRLPFPMLGLDTDNDTVFMNETVRDYCAAEKIELTRCRPYRKNDQAHVEQKNGEIVRRMVGYRRYEGIAAAEQLARLYAPARLFVNAFQPCFKLAGKKREGAHVKKRYHKPLTPCDRLLADARVDMALRESITKLRADLDPVRLLADIRSAQQVLVALADVVDEAQARTSQQAMPLDDFMSGLRTAWEDGEVRPTSRPKPKAKRGRRRPDPLAAVTDELRSWFEADPASTGRQLLDRLQAEYPHHYPDGLVRTVQRRLKIWRSELAHALVFGRDRAVDTSPNVHTPTQIDLRSGCPGPGPSWFDPSVASCSPPSRCGLSMAEPSIKVRATANLDGVCARRHGAAMPERTTTRCAASRHLTEKSEKSLGSKIE
jgi:hypothetical protein